MKTPRMKVGTRLGIGFALVLLMMAAIIATAINQFSNIGAVNNRIIEKDWVKANAINTIDTLTRENARYSLELLLLTDQTQVGKIKQKMDDNKKAISDGFDTLEKLIYKAEGKELLAKAKAARAVYVASFTKAITLAAEGKKDEAVAIMNAETLPALDALQAPISDLAKLQKRIVVASSEEVKDDIGTARNLILIFGVFALSLGIVASFVITRTLLKQLGGEPDYAADIAASIAAGDLAITIDVAPNDQTSLLFAMKTMRDSLVSLIGRVRSGTDTIATASGQIATGNLDLSSRTEEQASALEQTASSMEELTSTVKQNADNARQASQLAHSASEVASKGGAVVSQVVATMGSINESAKKIVDIIGVIDGIAFQTNILALNAAVEAARAGEQGRGFAVVATEVRNLAQRSAAAAKEIKALIGNSVEKVDAGAKLVDEAGVTMDEVVASVKRVTDIINEITSASNEQTSGIEQINQAIMQMDTVTQQNAALVEEAAAAAQSMQDQTGNLSRAVAVFKLTAETDHAATTKTAPSRPAAPIAKALPRVKPAEKLSAAKPVVPTARRIAVKSDEWEEF